MHRLSNCQRYENDENICDRLPAILRQGCYNILQLNQCHQNFKDIIIVIKRKYHSDQTILIVISLMFVKRSIDTECASMFALCALFSLLLWPKGDIWNFVAPFC